MDALISNLQSASSLVQALAVSVGGLLGVFATLAVFFVVIALSNRLGKMKN
jgi:hypothetical protein